MATAKRPATKAVAPRPAPAVRATMPVTPDVPISLGGDRAQEVQAQSRTAQTTQQAPEAPAAPGRAFVGTDDEFRAAMAQYGPDLVAAMSNPEVLGALKSMWADGSIKNPNLVEQRLRGTNWYRNQNTVARSKAQLEAENPAEAIRQMQDVRRSFERTAQRYGVQINSATLDSLANDAWRNGWDNDADRIQQSILGHFDAASGMGQGKIAGNAANIRAQLKKFGLPSSDVSVAKWAIDIASGTLDPDALSEMIKNQAKAKYPHLADMIDRGLTPDDYYQPFKQTLAQELEINPEDINFDSAEWSPVIDGGGTGKPMTLTETRRFARTKDAWRNTDAANRQAANMESFILRTFGKVA